MGFLHTFEPQPIAFTLGGIMVHWYGIFLSLAILTGLVIAIFLARRARLRVGPVIDILLFTTLAGFLGARLYHVLNEPAYYFDNPGEIFRIWNGGLAIHGGLIVGGLVFILLVRRVKLPLGLVADLAAPALLIGQAIGRWGNYFNQELAGRPTNLPWGIPIAPELRPDSSLGSAYFHPVFLYESLFDLAAGILFIFWFLRRQRQPDKGKPGSIAFAYLIAAGAGRFLVELLRIDRTPTVFGVRLPLLISLLMIVIGYGWFVYQRQKEKGKRQNLGLPL